MKNPKGGKLDFRLERFSFRSIELKGAKEVPLFAMGDGFKVLVSLLATLSGAPEGSVILLEWPEAHMHPEYTSKFLRYLVKFIKTKGNQAFMTTHSSDLIDGIVNPEFIENRDEKDFLFENTKIIRLSRKDNAIISEEMI